ncbi:acyl-CoA dehydrogenase [bacterium BMS3Abin04]|nr:acyl-CoA dehydrogenase [bacterium BMS3Abin04]
MSTNAMLTDNDKKLREKMRDFVSWVPKQLLLDMDADKVKYPKEFLQEAGKRNLLGLRFDPEWGGTGLPWTSEMVALEEVGVLGTSLGCLYSLVSIVGEAIHIFGTGEQKEKYLKPMIRGEIGVAEGLTEPRGGSDFFAATTTAHRKGNMFYLNGQKRFVVGAEGADLILVYGKIDGVDDPKKAMTAFLVERGPGVTVEHLYGLMGTRGGGTGRLVFRDAAVPIENVLGGENGIGNGTEVFHQMMIPERMTSAGAAIGMARAAIEIAARYADKRKAFGQKIRSFEAVNFKIADSITFLDAARAINYAAGKTADSDAAPGKIRRLVSEAKRFSTNTAWKIVNHAMQILGGIGYTNIFPIERILRDVRLITIWTGTNEIMDLVIQHEFYKEFLANPPKVRDLEQDAEGAEFSEEKVYNE